MRAEPLTADAEPAWAPAEAVLCPWIDPGGPRRILVGSSNGLAAGPDLESATESALRELVERDAFVWTWVQRVSRELIDPASLPGDVRDGVEALAGLGFETAFVNLTLETDPVDPLRRPRRGDDDRRRRLRRRSGPRRALGARRSRE